MVKKPELTKEQKIKVLCMELDYHLMCLQDAINASNKQAIQKEKRILAQLRKQKNDIEGTSEVKGI